MTGRSAKVPQHNFVDTLFGPPDAVEELYLNVTETQQGAPPRPGSLRPRADYNTVLLAASLLGAPPPTGGDQGELYMVNGRPTLMRPAGGPRPPGPTSLRRDLILPGARGAPPAPPRPLQPPAAPSQPPTNSARYTPDGREMQTQASGGQTRELLPMKTTKEHDQAVGVIYRTAERLAQSKVDIGAKLTRAHKGELDTFATRSRALEKRPSGHANEVVNASFGAATAEDQDLILRWARESMIWVCVSAASNTKPSFYTAVCKRDRTHHSSLSGGGDVLAAGEWIVSKGKLMSISANSGHYRPTLDTLYQAILHLTPAIRNETTVLMYNTVRKRWVERGVREFIFRPSDGGTYKVHPQA